MSEELPESLRIEPALEPKGPPPLRPLLRPRQAPPAPPRSRSRRLIFWLLLAFLTPPLGVLALRWLPPPITAFMLQSQTKPVHYQWVPAERIADSLRRAVIAAEDQKFRTHQGFDIEAIEKAYVHNQKSRKRRGASTISQQTAKNLFLWPGGGYVRKAIEATFTVLIELLWGKDRILEVYLNVAEFGPGLYGAEAAAQRLFGKSAAQLSVAEAAQLAAVLPNPRRWSARAPGPYVQKRTRWILGQMGYGRPAPADEPEPLPPLAPGEDMPALDAWQSDDPPAEPEGDGGEALPADSTAPAAEKPAPEPAPEEPAPDSPAPEPESTPGITH